MGSVYLARDPVLDRMVAIKVFAADLDTSDARERFSREARALAPLTHPNIVTVHDFGEHQSRLFIVMEYVAGETLAGLIRRKVPVPIANKLVWMEELCAGAGYAHKMGLVHRDIKPTNLIIDGSGRLKILDFGIVRTLGRELDTAPLMGTPGYMAPEQIRGTQVDARTDLFSIGVVFYELLTYTAAFSGDTFAMAIHRVLNEEPMPLGQLVPEATSEITGIIERTLKKNPSDRFPNAETLRRAIERARQELPPATDPVAVGQGFAIAAAEMQSHARPTGAAAPRLLREETRDAIRENGKPEHTAQPDEFATLPGLSPTAGFREPPVVDRTVFFGSPGSRTQPDDLLSAKLIVLECSDPRVVGRTFPLAGKSVVLGRDGHWLGVADPAWSRQHAAIEYVDEGFILRDLGSANGTRVNGRRVPSGSAQALFFGARIAIGSAVLTFAHVGESSLPDLTGAVIDERYVLEERLREGPKGALYVARDRRLPGRVALKILSPQMARFAGYRARFQREAELARQLQHPHICKVLDYGQGDIKLGGDQVKVYFLCLELMEGGNLADRLERQEVPDKQRVAQWMDRIATALSYAHRRGVVHGDIKPTTIVFDGDDNPYVTDFSIAKDGEIVVGTPAYMAPEQWEGTAAMAAVDQFALASVAYYAITGSRAFEGQEHPEIRRRNFALGPLPAHTEAERNGRSGVLRGVSLVLARALATRPDDRYPTIDQFTSALTAALVRPARRTDAAKLFVSYQRESMAGWVNFFADRIRTKGLSVFVDTHNRDNAGGISEHVSQAIEDAVVFVCFVGDRTLESRWVRDEIALAYHYGKPMIPVFQEGYVRPPEETLSPGMKKLLASQGVHLHDRRNLNPEGTVDDLVSLLRSLEGEPI
jgi:serine/threonine protein kinase